MCKEEPTGIVGYLSNLPPEHRHLPLFMVLAGEQLDGEPTNREIPLPVIDVGADTESEEVCFIVNGLRNTKNDPSSVLSFEIVFKALAAMPPECSEYEPVLSEESEVSGEGIARLDIPLVAIHMSVFSEPESVILEVHDSEELNPQ